MSLNNIFYNAEKLDVIKGIYDKHYRAMCYFAYKLIKDKSEAEDIAMNVFLSLLSRKNEINRITSIKSFLYKSTYNKCVDYIRKQHSKNNYTHYIQSNEELEKAGTNEIIITQVLQAIYGEIENLPEQRKVIFKAIYLEGKSTSTIAHELNISQQTVLNQKSKAIQTIKIKLSLSGVDKLLLSSLMYLLFR